MSGLHTLVNAQGASATILPFDATPVELRGDTYRHTVVYAFSID